MKLTLAALASAAALALAPVGAYAQHVDVGPGGVGVHGDHHEEHHETTVERHHDDHPVVHEHSDHHDDGHADVRVDRH